MAFSIVGNTIRAGDESFETSGSHTEAVRIARAAIEQAETTAADKRLSKSAVKVLALEELKRALNRSILAFTTIVESSSPTSEGKLIKIVDPIFPEIARLLATEPDLFYTVGDRRWEEIVASLYDQWGFDEVTLTHRSGDKGRDVIAIKVFKDGLGSVRIIDQVKAYSPSHRVTADEVRSLMGTLSVDLNATKAFLTTTGYFAPGIASEDQIQQLVPNRLQLIDRTGLIKRLESALDL